MTETSATQLRKDLRERIVSGVCEPMPGLVPGVEQREFVSPISFRRCTTEYATRPYMPMAARSTAINANTVSNIARKPRTRPLKMSNGSKPVCRGCYEAEFEGGSGKLV